MLFNILAMNKLSSSVKSDVKLSVSPRKAIVGSVSEAQITS